MIERYSLQCMKDVWSEESKFNLWLEIESLVCDAYAEFGMIPEAAAKNIRNTFKNTKLNIDRIKTIECDVRHDVVAFLVHISEIFGDDSRFIHFGLTSSDLVDTSFNFQLKRASELILDALDGLLIALKNLALEHKFTPMIGRTHGMHAEPTTFGLKIAQFYAEISRGKSRLQSAKTEISTCVMSGSVGTFANIDPRIEEYVSEKLGLKPEPISTQIAPRDRHAVFFATLGIIAGSIERFAIEIRLLQQTEIAEVEEGFNNIQIGSSSMPHKRNPILTENLTGLSRLVRSAVVPALENIAIWNERDISHSSVERGIGPDTTTHIHFAIDRLTSIVQNLVVNPKRMLTNLNLLNGSHNAQRVLLAIVRAGENREIAFGIIQENAQRSIASAENFQDCLMRDERITTQLSEETIKSMFDLDYHLKHIDFVFARVFV